MTDARGIVEGRLAALAAHIDEGRSLVVSDGLVRRLYGEGFPRCPVVEVPRGEAAKSLDELRKLYEALDKLGLDRSSTIVAIGGGSVSDLAGFAAATWLRGIGFAAVPTTLLAMIDASLGGKNGIDFGGRKNRIGTIRQPDLVLMDTAFLDSLPDEQFASGMAEAIKAALIAGPRQFDFVVGECRSRAGMDAEKLQLLIGRAQELKLRLTSADPEDRGERRLLNLGHSLGHAMESACGLPHGHAVAAGMASALRIAASLLTEGGESRERRRNAECLECLRDLLGAWSLPSSIAEAWLAASPPTSTSRSSEKKFRAAIASALDADKKRGGDMIDFVLPIAAGTIRVERLPLRSVVDFVMEGP